MSNHEYSNIFTEKEPEQLYVAFIDILGFSSFVVREFNNVTEIYNDVMGDNEVIKGINAGVRFRVYSDAFLLTSKKLGDLVGVVQGIYMRTLGRDWLVRGGIGYGKHIEASDNENLFVVSEAMVYAVEKEKTVKYPCVAFHKSVSIPKDWWDSNVHPLDRGIACFEGISMILPFNRYWCQSAMTRVAMMTPENENHKEKYDWFLRLYDRTISGDPLVPDETAP